jgi:GTP-binding protein
MTKRTVALVGRPNVGKSTLFNRIVGGRRAIVDDQPGITRDRNFAEADWNGTSFWLVDTGGWIEGAEDPISRGIREQVTQAVEAADVIALVVDTMEGLHPADLEVAGLLRGLSDRVVVVANKADDLPANLDHHVFYELGLGDPQPVSAATGKGSGDLLDRLTSRLEVIPVTRLEGDVIQVAVVGRPNVGKSSIVNRLLGQERSIVAPESGTTRDAVDSPLRYQGATLNFIDTAGLRKRPKVKDDIEFYSTLRTERAMDRAQICVLVVDGMIGMHAQDLRIADRAWKAGSGLIVAVNKWDLVPKDEATAEEGRRVVVERAPFLNHVPFVYVSALTGLRVRKLLDFIISVARERETRVQTSEVNEVLQRLIARNQPPQAVGREVKLLYASQVAVAPPTFAVVTNRPEAVPEAYQRYLLNGFYDAWGFLGTPLRLRLRRRRGSR